MYEKFSLAGKAVLLVGATGILGKHFSHGYARAGARVIAADIDPGSVERLVSELNSQYGRNHHGFTVDLRSEESIVDLKNQVFEIFDRVDVLHNNAATKSSDARAYFKPFEKYDTKIWDEVMDVNVKGIMLTCKIFGPEMEKTGGGSIINTASIYGVVAPDQRIYEDSDYPDLGGSINTPAVYSVSKAAIIGLTKYLATYWADKNIRVNAMSPGGVESGQNEMFVNKYSNRVPMGRMAEAEDIVGTAVFLASDASSYMTGQNIIIDGGLTVW